MPLLEPASAASRRRSRASARLQPPQDDANANNDAVETEDDANANDDAVEIEDDPNAKNVDVETEDDADANNNTV